MMRRWILTLSCLLALPAAASAQALEDYDYENLSFRGVGLDFGYIWPNKVEPTPSYTLSVDLGYLGPGIRVAPSLTYWSSAMKATELGRLAGQLNRLDALQRQGASVTAADLGEIDWSDVSLGLGAQYVRYVTPRVQAHVGTGVALHKLNGSGPAVEGTFIEDLLDSITAGLNASVGAELSPLERLTLMLEGGYTLLGDIRYPEARIGVSFDLARRGAAASPQ